MRQDQPDGEEELDEEDAGPSSQKRYITRSGAERLHKELLRLLNEERPKVTAEVSAAAAQGDRSENAEYIYGKKRLREIDRRIRFLTKRLDTSTVVTPSEQTDVDKVYFGATVSLEDEDGPSASRTSSSARTRSTPRAAASAWTRPSARRCCGKRRGDSVTVLRPRGEIELTILSIRYV